MYCPQCGAANNDNDKYCAKCGNSISVAAEQARWAPTQGALNAKDMQASEGLVYAGFWRRFGAVVIDGMLVWAASLALALVTRLGIAPAMGGSVTPGSGAVLMVLGFWGLVPWLYFALMESSAHQGTLGKMAVGIKVTDLAGQRIGFGRATGRFWGKVISQLILYIGYIMAAFTARKQALHDMMAGTLVVHREPSPGLVASAAAARPMPGWVIALIVLGCFVPVAGVLAAIAIPAYQDYSIRAQVSQGLNLASGPKAEVAGRLAGTEGPVAETLRMLAIDPVSDTFVSSMALDSGAIVITYGNQAHGKLMGETLALVPARDGAGRISWLCGYQRAAAGSDLGNADPASLTTLPPKYLPRICRP